MAIQSDFVNYVRHGGVKPRVSLQIGAGAGFDCKLAGKEWNSEGTLADTIAAYEIVGCEPLFNVGLPAFGDCVPELKWNCRPSKEGEFRVTESFLKTPYGTISWEMKEKKYCGGTPTRYPLSSESQRVFEIVNWYAEQFAKGINYVPELIAPIVNEAHAFGPVCIQWNVQPFELMGLLSVDNLAILAMLEPEKYRMACDFIRNINIELIKAIFEGGADFIFLGAPAAEMISPMLYEKFIIPDSKKICDAVHAAGGLVYSHICSPIEPFLTMGFYNQMGLDLFETLSPPPVGNVEDFAKARQILDKNMCTRGNIGLDLLLNGTPEQIAMATHSIVEKSRGYKHFVAASDYLFYDIPLENVKAVVDTVQGCS